ncbi:hypothetical protein UC317_2078 [Lactococcus lactis subsp. lactis]|nr:XcbB/CpsF family capsular polysaccharide biosynthesis protein [Lactococcus lactis]ARE10730.1 XcbB/CpsF family capsular polysaccharide biosynthesis protein [Lactococcus lactis subsp. lactis]KSU31682.1 hypothetical protein UC317_2078 [Lactococcus lactis subsp. lactis]URL09738.1 XcbB/CpsF family capsular polysaccharide biosynthesis protein [Lactococcus lactis subsp. lactis]
MIKVLSFGCPATKDILDYNPFNNNRNYSLTYHKGYQAIPELNLLLDEIVPDSTNVVLFDFVSEAMFGTVYQNEKVTTRNFWIKNWGSEQVYTSTDFEATFGIWKKEVAKFIQYFLEKNIVLVLNSFRFSPEMVIDNENPQPTSKEYPTIEKQEYYNQFLQKAEKYVEEKFPQVKIIKFNQSSKVEKNHPIKAYSFYLNEDYYLDSFVQFETLIKERFLKDVTDYNHVTSEEEIYFQMGKKNYSFLIQNEFEKTDNMLVTAWKKNDSVERKILNESALGDYILDGKYGNTYRFIPRKSFFRKELKEFITASGNKIFFTDRRDEVRMKSETSKKIVFYFMPISGGVDWRSANAMNRLMPYYFKHLSRSLIKNTIIIRIADINGVRGSGYTNSYNYENYESDLSEFIEEMILRYIVNRKDVVLYGVSKGGAGGLFYAAKHNLNSVTVDPLISKNYSINYENDTYLFHKISKDLDLVPIINEKLEFLPAHNYVIGNHYVKETWDEILRLKGVQIFDIDDETVKIHRDISPNCVPEQLMLINRLLLNI